MDWTLADRVFTRPVALGGYDRTFTGIMFQELPNPAPGGPTHMISGNWSGGASAVCGHSKAGVWPGHACRHDAFYLGRYDSAREVLNIDMDLGPQVVSSGLTNHGFPVGQGQWQVVGRGGGGRLIATSWLSFTAGNEFTVADANAASLVQEFLYDHAAKQLISRPVRVLALAITRATSGTGFNRAPRSGGRVRAAAHCDLFVITGI
jgi:hypothetical protein